MLKQVESHIADLLRRLRVAVPAPSPAATAPAAKKRRLSPEGRAHIVAAQKKRRAAVNTAKKAQPTRRTETGSEEGGCEARRAQGCGQGGENGPSPEADGAAAGRDQGEAARPEEATGRPGRNVARGGNSRPERTGRYLDFGRGKTVKAMRADIPASRSAGYTERSLWQRGFLATYPVPLLERCSHRERPSEQQAYIHNSWRGSQAPSLKVRTPW